MLNQQKTDKQLLQDMQEGDREAGNELLTRWRPQARKIAHRYAANEDEKQDIVQVALARLWSHVESYNPEYDSEPWIATCIYNEAKRYVRRSRCPLQKEPLLPETNTNETLPEDYTQHLIDKETQSPYETALQHYRTQALQHALDWLQQTRPNWHRALYLYEIEGVPSTKIAKDYMDASQSTVIRYSMCGALLMARYLGREPNPPDSWIGRRAAQQVERVYEELGEPIADLSDAVQA